MINAKKFFEKATLAGITSSCLTINISTSTSVSIYHGEIDSYVIEGGPIIYASGIYNGKYGSCCSDLAENSSIDFLIKSIIETASVSERTDCLDFFKGSEKYKKRYFLNKHLKEQPIEEKIAFIKDIDTTLSNIDPEISDVEGVSYYESEDLSYFYNSYGLKLSSKTNDCGIGAAIVLKRGDDVKTASKGIHKASLEDINKEKFINDLVKEGKAKLGASQCKAGKYPTLLDKEVFGVFISSLLGANSSIAVQKNTSFLTGLEGKMIGSNKLTIDEVPLKKGPCYSYYDAEGVAQYNKRIVNKGVLLTHFYNRETAKKANRETTANASIGGGKIGLSYCNPSVKAGRKSKEEMIAKIKRGVYITDIDGYSTGYDSSSGDFSCQAEGFMIRDGKIAEPLNLITLSGNILDVMKNIKSLSNDTGEKLGRSIPDALIKKMSIGGQN